MKLNIKMFSLIYDNNGSYNNIIYIVFETSNQSRNIIIVI